MMKKRILLIDDEDLVIRSLGKLLTKSGYEVSVVSTGMDAVVMVEDNNFDLIISDIKMPWINGVETVKELNTAIESKQQPLPPVIFITGYADKECEEKAKELNPIAYMHKPIDIQELLSAVQKALA